MGLFGGDAPKKADPVLMNTAGTIMFPVWQPMFPCADDVLRALYSRRHPPGSRWKFGRATWLRIIRLKDGNGAYIFHPQITFTGSEDELTLFGLPVDVLDSDPDAFYIEEPDTATGHTERLPRLCRECHSGLPAEARYCIVCGAPVYLE